MWKTSSRILFVVLLALMLVLEHVVGIDVLRHGWHVPDVFGVVLIAVGFVLLATRADRWS